jgi:hypothetical protein
MGKSKPSLTLRCAIILLIEKTAYICLLKQIFDLNSDIVQEIETICSSEYQRIPKSTSITVVATAAMIYTCNKHNIELDKRLLRDFILSAADSCNTEFKINNFTDSLVKSYRYWDTHNQLTTSNRANEIMNLKN